MRAWELTWLLVLEYLPVCLEGVWQGGVCGRGSGQAQVCRPRPRRGPIPRPARGLAVEHPQLVVHRVRADLVVALLLRGCDVAQNSIYRGDLKVGHFIRRWCIYFAVLAVNIFPFCRIDSDRRSMMFTRLP